MPPVNRSVRFRVAALWAAMLLALTWGGDAYGLHACPHHLAIAQAGADMHGGAHRGHERHPAPVSHQGGCTCVGSCSAGATGLPAPAPRFVLAVTVSPAAPAPLDAPAWRLPSRAAYLLPYPTAPPAAALREGPVPPAFV